MNYHIDSKSQEPAYLQLYNYIRTDIVDGVYKAGERLPSKRIIAEESLISVITVQHAYALLCDEGYVEARERSGYFVIYKEADFSEFPERRKERIDLEPDTISHAKGEFSYNILSKTMRRVLLDYGEKILVKSPNEGCLQLREAIRIYLARNRGINVDVKQIVIGSGAEYLYMLIGQLFDSDTVFAIEDPCYNKIPLVYEATGHKTDRLVMGNDGILSSELVRTNAGVLHVTPFHSYPSGVSVGITKKKEYLQWGSEGRYIIEDNYDSELTVSTKMEDSLFSLTDRDNVIYMNTFSKTIAPSLRTGYMILPNKLIPIFEEKLGFYSCTVPVFEQYVLSELLLNGDFERHINRVRRQLRRKL